MALDETPTDRPWSELEQHWVDYVLDNEDDYEVWINKAGGELVRAFTSDEKRCYLILMGREWKKLDNLQQLKFFTAGVELALKSSKDEALRP